jgi:phage tail tube protein FII
MLTNEQIIKNLNKKIKKMEQSITTQKNLIEVLKSLPSNKDVKQKKKGKKKNGVFKRTQGKSGAVVTNGTSREPEINSGNVESNDTNTQIMAQAKPVQS